MIIPLRAPNPWADREEADRLARSTERVVRAFATSVREHRERFGPAPEPLTAEQETERETRRQAFVRTAMGQDAVAAFEGLLKLTEREMRESGL